MALPVVPPVAPMLARLVRELPDGDGDLVYEPKWDGFRALVFRDGDDVDIRSRNDRPLTRYFPEVTAGLRAVGERRFVLDGEIVATAPDGTFDFEALMLRLHPVASRVAALARQTPASFIAFDMLAIADDDLRAVPFAERRHRLERLLEQAPAGVLLTPATDDRATATTWLAGHRGVDGVVAKPRGLLYEPGRRTMVKVKTDRTADCVVAGFRVVVEEPAVASLLLALYDGGELRHVGVASSFRREQRHALVHDLAPLVVPLGAHPWREGFGIGRSPVGRLKGAAGRWTPDMAQDWVPVEPRLVCEVSYDHFEHGRFRHPARFRRWRPDRDARSCTFDQLPEADPATFADIAGA